MGRWGRGQTAKARPCRRDQAVWRRCRRFLGESNAMGLPEIVTPKRTRDRTHKPPSYSCGARPVPCDPCMLVPSLQRFHVEHPPHRAGTRVQSGSPLSEPCPRTEGMKAIRLMSNAVCLGSRGRHLRDRRREAGRGHSFTSKLATMRGGWLLAPFLVVMLASTISAGFWGQIDGSASRVGSGYSVLMHITHRLLDDSIDTSLCCNWDNGHGRLVSGPTPETEHISSIGAKRVCGEAGNHFYPPSAPCQEFSSLSFSVDLRARGAVDYSSLRVSCG